MRLGELAKQPMWSNCISYRSLKDLQSGMKRGHEVGETRTNKENQLERKSTHLNLHWSPTTAKHPTSMSPVTRWCTCHRCIGTWTGIRRAWSMRSSRSGRTCRPGCCPTCKVSLQRHDNVQQQNRRASPCQALSWPLLPSRLPNLMLISPEPNPDPETEKETLGNVVLLGQEDMGHNLADQENRADTNYQYHDWKRGDITTDFTDIWQNKLRLICRLPSIFPCCLRSPERASHEKSEDIKLPISLISLLREIFQRIKAKPYTLGQLEHQDLLCKRILQVAERGHVSWKFIISLTNSKARAMKVKIVSHFTLKINEIWGEISWKENWHAHNTFKQNRTQP